MNTLSAFIKTSSCIAALVAGVAAAQAQITITNADMFNQPGQYYYAWSNDTNTTPDLSGLTLTGSSSPQYWDFSSGPTNVTYLFEYVPASQGSNGAQFVTLGATVAQRQTNTNNPSDVEFLFFKMDTTQGQIDYGFYDPAFSASQPESYFTNGLQDFPNRIQFGSSWSGSTVFESIYTLAGLGDFPDQVTYTSTDTVDAFGYVNLPTFGLQECLRVHEMVEYDIGIDLSSITGQPGYSSAGTYYVLNYYWLVPGHGIAVQINSQQQTTQPPDDMSTGAATLVRMFSAYHPVTNAPPAKAYIQNLKLSFLPTAGFLSWTLLPESTAYTVQYTTNPASSTNWQTLTITATNSNFALDPAAVNKSSPRRFYRVLAPVGSK